MWVFLDPSVDAFKVLGEFLVVEGHAVGELCDTDDGVGVEVW